jgi:hypothetical protein
LFPVRVPRQTQGSKEERNHDERRGRKEVESMKYYLADFDIRDGEYEYEFQFLVHAANLADAENKAIEGLCYNYGVDRSVWDEKHEELDLFSRIIRKGNLPQELPDNEAAILKKYFWVATDFTERASA